MDKEERAKRHPIKLGEIISESFEEGFLGLAREMVRVFEVWDRAVGAYNVAKARPDSIKNGRLTVLVASPVWIDHFGYLKSQFMEKINESLGAPLVRDIVFRVGHIEPPQKENVPPAVPEQSRDFSSEPAAPYIESAVDLIHDEDLKDHLASFLQSQKGPRKE
jgi:hypothetical protein